MSGRWIVVLLALLTVAVSWGFGFDVGRGKGHAEEYKVWQDTLIEWGCAGYDARTAEWTLTGGTCRPTALDWVEPKDEK